MAERRHLGSNAPSTTTLDGGGAGSPGAPQKALSAEQEKHYSHAKINEVTKSEQNQCVAIAIARLPWRELTR